MQLKHQILLGLLWLGASTNPGTALAQGAAQVYTLISGSQLTDDCPICDRLPIVVPLSGTFGLSLVEQNSLFTRYELQNISFQTSSNASPTYQVTGNGVYQVGGEVAYLQNLFLDIQVNNGATTTKALCASTNSLILQPWPKIQISVDQTNGTPGQVYHLNLVAVPMPQIASCSPDLRTGSIRLEWPPNGGPFQLERAASPAGPYSAITPITTNSSFTDVGVLTNYPQLFYRLRQF